MKVTEFAALDITSHQCLYTVALDAQYSSL